jgi:hypothetical protein
MNPWGIAVPPSTEAAFFNAAVATTFLLVEGGSDARFWEPRVHSSCQVRVMDGRPKALAEIRAARSEKRPGILAILDADLDLADNSLVPEEGVIWTDLNDMEAMLIASPALEKVLAEVASKKKIGQFESRGCTVREQILRHASTLGEFRLVARRRGLVLIFRKKAQRPGKSDHEEGSNGTDGFRYMGYGDFCNRADWAIDRLAMSKTVLNFSGRQDLNPETVSADAAIEARTVADRWHLVNGHDAVGLLSVGCRKAIGNRNLSIEELQERLRLASEGAHLEKTLMYKSLRDWEAANPTFRVLGWS